MHHDLPPGTHVAPKTGHETGGVNVILRELDPAAHLPHAEQGHSHVPVHYSGRTKRGVAIFAAAVAVGLGAIFFYRHNTNSRAEAALVNEVTEAANQPVPVDVIHVQRAPAQTVLSLPGRTSAWYETTLYARVNGYVSAWKKDIGAHVKAGDLLATVETPELDDQYTATEAKLHELEAERNVAQTAVDFAKVSYQRWEAAAPQGVVSPQERDQKKSEWDEAVAKLKAADAQIASGKAELARLDTLRKFKEVRAPFDGVITNREVDIGALVTAGSTTNTSPLFTIAQYDTTRVFVEVPEGAVPDIHNGMDVSVVAREFPNRKFTGKVERTAEAIDPVTKTLKVEVDVPNPKLRLLPGMYVMATFQTSREQPPLRIPAAALAFGPSGPEVAVVSTDGRLRFRPITIGRDLGDSVEIASGLTGNETVALNVGSQVSDGERVDPHPIDASVTPSVPSAKPTVTAEATPAASRNGL